jgi:hypothetical protein
VQYSCILARASWDEGNTAFNIADLEGCKAWIGVDLSKVTDLCAVSASIQIPVAANDNEPPRPAVAAIMSTGRAAANASKSTSYVNEKWADGLAFA